MQYIKGVILQKWGEVAMLKEILARPASHITLMWSLLREQHSF
ncbi:hypothetical protein IMCC1989_1069 [gamma proteobacterium IMCC1989]|nr:hypothetical protein IMCC1989_1069 [gamma proteobacterium IMCC1989]